MKNSFFFVLCIITLNSVAQENPTELARPIVAEGKRLYRAEMASWYGTDLFIENYKKADNIGGYFSYTEEGISKCIFYSKGENPKVIGTISFDETYDAGKAKVDLEERTFSSNEETLYMLRNNASLAINGDTLFKVYNNTNFNLIPIISEGQRKVYILTGPKEGGVVILGNDYLLTFDNDNNLVSKKQLHKNIIPIYVNKKENKEQEMGAMHTHLPETGAFITATDICTLMLYEKSTTWEQHNVISKEYLNIWNCKTDELTVVPMNTMDKINDDQRKRRR